MSTKPEKVYNIKVGEQDLNEIIALQMSDGFNDALLASLLEQKEMQDAPDNDEPMDMYGKVL